MRNGDAVRGKHLSSVFLLVSGRAEFSFHLILAKICTRPTMSQILS